jgi:hypothetical protein
MGTGSKFLLFTKIDVKPEKRYSECRAPQKKQTFVSSNSSKFNSKNEELKLSKIEYPINEENYISSGYSSSQPNDQSEGIFCTYLNRKLEVVFILPIIIKLAFMMYLL